MTPTDFRPPTARSRTPLALWRVLPFTAQLLVIGMTVGLFWFLASRAAAERQQAGARERNAQLVRLHRAEILAGRLGRWLTEMSRDQRAFLLTGDRAFLRHYANDSVALELDAARLVVTARSADVASDLAELRRAIDRWRREALAPNIALREASGLAAFGEGGPGAGGVRLSAVLVDSALAAQARLERRLNAEVQVTAILADEAATRDDLSTLLTSTGGLAVLLLLLTLLMRIVARALEQVMAAARAIDAGRYREVHFPDSRVAPNREMAELSRSFEQLAASTEQRERQLQDDVERLTELERLKRDFVSTVSHELRTPLTSVRGALGLLVGGKAGELPVRARELLQIAMTNTERLIRLINDILDVERMEAGEAALRREPLRLRAIVESTLTALEAFAREHSVTLAITSGPADAELIGDPDRLTQVLTNLISNAVKFSPAGAAVEVDLAPAEEGVMLRVRDHGPGIPAEFASRIFGRFQQAGGADQRRGGGTGLGLNIARGLVERHGGRIGYEAAEGGGTIFWVWLPAIAVGEEPTPTSADARRAVLLIEDDASMREVLVALVEPIARAIAVPSGEAAFEVLETEPVSVIVLDLVLPGMDGFTFSRRLRQDPRLRRLPVILFSAQEHTPEELRQAGIRAADAYVKTRDSEAVLFERLRREVAAAR
jgi:signal transduction histidine kinase